MKNQFDTEAPFKAYFLPDSSPELSVSPTVGILDTYQGDGTEFKVSFTPKTYGKAFMGKLVVETEEMQWIYEVNFRPAVIFGRASIFVCIDVFKLPLLLCSS